MKLKLGAAVLAVAIIAIAGNIPVSANSGTYNVTIHGHEATLIATERPSTVVEVSGYTYWCHTITLTFRDFGITDFLWAGTCWDSHTADSYAYGGSCTQTLPGGSCHWRQIWAQCQSCGGQGVYVIGRFYQDCAWWVSCNDELFINQRPNGSWSAWGFGI